MAYASLINQANQNTLKANQEIQGLVNLTPKMGYSNSNTSQVSNSSSQIRVISIETALQDATVAASPDSQLSIAPALVNFNGETAYEVVFNSGSIYVAAKNGQILYNGTRPHVLTQKEAGQIALKSLGGNNSILQIDQINLNNKVLWRTIMAAGHMV
ncbi:MAG: hypothetical protein WCG34_12625 [Leptolinea sp.]